MTVTFLSVTPIGDTNPLDLPVANAARAAEFYRDRLGFEVLGLEPTTATVTRDAVTLRLAQNGGDPEQASCYIAVSDVNVLQQEYHAQGITGEVSEMQHDQTTYQVIWVRDPDGICFCLGHPKAEKAG